MLSYLCRVPGLLGEHTRDLHDTVGRVDGHVLNTEDIVTGRFSLGMDQVTNMITSCKLSVLTDDIGQFCELHTRQAGNSGDLELDGTLKLVERSNVLELSHGECALRDELNAVFFGCQDLLAFTSVANAVEAKTDVTRRVQRNRVFESVVLLSRLDGVKVEAKMEVESRGEKGRNKRCMVGYDKRSGDAKSWTNSNADRRELTYDLHALLDILQAFRHVLRAVGVGDDLQVARDESVCCGIQLVEKDRGIGDGRGWERVSAGRLLAGSIG